MNLNSFLNASTLDQISWWAFLLLLVVLTIRYFFRKGTPRNNPVGIDGDLIWVDEGKKTKAFFNRTFEILGKPDAMYRTSSGVCAVEYKSRKSGVLDSDIAQAKCAALAARAEGYKVNEIVVITRSERKSVALPRSDSDLFKEIRPLVKTIRDIRRGSKGEAKPNGGKCFNCAYRSSCSSRAA